MAMTQRKSYMYWLLYMLFPRKSDCHPSKIHYRLSRARMTIDNSLGRLKGRWRCLQKRLKVDVEFACTVISACVILHNICEISRETYDDRCNFERDDETGVVLFHVCKQRHLPFKRPSELSIVILARLSL
jgi:hypothetical protein